MTGSSPGPSPSSGPSEDENIGVFGIAPQGSPDPSAPGSPEVTAPKPSPEVSTERSPEGSPEENPFPGFTVAPGATLSVKMRLAVTSDAVANEVVAHAAVVQRYGDDGDWVGESNDYRFRIQGADEAGVTGDQNTENTENADEHREHRER